jgi:SAM-dependent methyltransferase
MERPYSPASERNRDPILAILRDLFADRKKVLEIGSGTGQHAAYFGAHLPHLVWQTTDVPENHPGIRAWLQEADLPNVMPPLALDVSSSSWPDQTFDAVYTANTCHIMSWPEVEAMFAGIEGALEPDGILCIYGPFNYNGVFTSDSNARFDAALRAQAPHMGIRDVEAMDALAARYGLKLEADHPMPANNRLRVWRCC